jgi:hypothetical protein
VKKEIRALQKKKKTPNAKSPSLSKTESPIAIAIGDFSRPRAESADRDLQTNKKNQTPPSDIFWIFWIAIGHWTREADFGGSAVAKRRVGRVAARGANEKSRRGVPREASGGRVRASRT